MRHVCIVGGGSALAQHLIGYYSSEGYRVTAVCHKTPPVDPVESNVKVMMGVDMSLPWCAARLSDLDPINILITLTGAVANAKLTDMTQKQWHSVINANLTSVYQALRYGIPLIEHGNIVVVGSIVGSAGGYGCANYAAAKAGLEGLVHAAANEDKRGNCINLLELGYINCGMGANVGDRKAKIEETIPLKRFGEAEEFVSAVAFLGEVSYMTGNTLTFAGGLR